MARFVAGAAQIACVAGDVAANLALHHAAIAEARGRGVDLLVFPELSLTDYESVPDTGRLAMAADDPRLLGLARVTGDMIAIVGFLERNPNGKPFNSAAILAGGRVAQVHRKLNLPTYGGLREGLCYAPGRRLDLAATRLGPLATLICADTWNPALPWLAALRGAVLMAVPVASASGAVSAEFDSRGGWAVNLRHTALTYGLPVVMTNHCGRRGGLDFWGGSAIVDASGREIVRAGDGPALITAALDLADGVLARAQLPTMRDADPDLVAAELQRVLAAESPLRRHAEEHLEGASRSTHNAGACFETARAAPPQHDAAWRFRPGSENSGPGCEAAP